MFILDTNVISELRKGARADVHVVRWSFENPAESQYLSAITIFEVATGILKIRKTDAAKADLLQDWLDNAVLPSFNNRILPLDQLCAIELAKLMHPRTRPLRDAMIAATAITHELFSGHPQYK